MKNHVWSLCYILSNNYKINDLDAFNVSNSFLQAVKQISRNVRKRIFGQLRTTDHSDRPVYSSNLFRFFTGRILEHKGCSVSLCLQRRHWSDCEDGRTSQNAHFSRCSSHIVVCQTLYGSRHARTSLAVKAQISLCMLTESLDTAECITGEQRLLCFDTVRMRRKIWICACCACTKAHFYFTRHNYIHFFVRSLLRKMKYEREDDDNLMIRWYYINTFFFISILNTSCIKRWHGLIYIIIQCRITDDCF